MKKHLFLSAIFSLMLIFLLTSCSTSKGKNLEVGMETVIYNEKAIQFTLKVDRLSESAYRNKELD